MREDFPQLKQRNLYLLYLFHEESTTWILVRPAPAQIGASYLTDSVSFWGALGFDPAIYGQSVDENRSGLTRVS